MNKLIYILLLSLSFGCANQDKVEGNRSRYVDDIYFDANLDSESFVICNGDAHVKQYFNNSKGLEYEGGKRAIDLVFGDQYIPVQGSADSGLIRIRFIVNCKGETGRFRLLGMNTKYEEKQFSNSISDQLLQITKGLTGWKSKMINGDKADYYQYLIFKIVDGRIVKILP